MSDPTPPIVHLFPLDLIDCGAITRDRTNLDPEAMRELERSIEASGLRQPIELFERNHPYEGRTHGLISGHRRLVAFRNLHKLRGGDRWATIPAFIRGSTDMATAFAAMVEENEIRAGISPYERGLIAVRARDDGAFGSIEDAIEGLYPTASRYKRLRLRTVAHFAETVGSFFKTPAKLSERQIERVMRSVDHGLGDRLQTALEGSGITDHEDQWNLIQLILEETEASARNRGPSSSRGRSHGPRRNPRPVYGVNIQRQRTRDGWALRFTGSDATSALMDLVMDEIERMYAPA